MKGIVFTEFLEMVEKAFSSDMVDRIIDSAELRSSGAYTTVGTYDHREMIELVACLSRETGTPAPELIRAFGIYLFGRFNVLFPHYFESAASTFDFLRQVEDYIHIEVRKLYPEAELPSFTCESPDPRQLSLVYHSSRPFAALAEGLIRGCIAHYREPIELEVEDLSDGAGTAARFILTKKAAAA
jgi:hypothetical protein